MNTKLVDSVTAEFKKVKHPDFRVGDIIEVHTKIAEGDKDRIQVFTGIVLSIKGQGTSKTYTVRKISYGIGVEKTFPLYSPNVVKIKIVKRGKVKRSKLYFLRQRIGKAALKAGVQIPVEGEEMETQVEEEVEESQAEQKEEAEAEKAGPKEQKDKDVEIEEKKESKASADDDESPKEKDTSSSPEKAEDDKKSG